MAAKWLGVRDIKPKAIFPTAETLYDHQREIIETAFQAEIYNQYGSMESRHREGEEIFRRKNGFAKANGSL